MRGIVANLIETLPLKLPITWNDPFWIINMGIEHERIHIETSSVLIRELPIEKVKENPLFKICPYKGDAPVNDWVSFSGKKITLGKSHSNSYYGWDNEYGEKTVEVKDFKASKYLSLIHISEPTRPY